MREGSIRWETNLSLESFSQKIVKKIETVAFNNKIKIIKAFIPEKIKSYIEINLSKEIDYFEKKYSYDIEFISDPQFVIPEYKIELLNKSKKIIDKIENIKKIEPKDKVFVEKNKTAKENKKIKKLQTSRCQIKTLKKRLVNLGHFGQERGRLANNTFFR